MNPYDAEFRRARRQRIIRRKRDWWGVGGWTLLIVALLLFFAAASQVGRLASESTAKNALVTQGFTEIHLVKRHIYFVQVQGCGHEDVAKFDYEATNPAHKRVRVSVCEGWPFKGATVRGTE